jgi:hypothetical protein
VVGGAPLKIVLIELPGMLRELLLEALSNQPDLVVVDELDTSDCPDFLIVEADDGEPTEPYLEVLLACPALRVIAITREGMHGFLHELQPHATRLGELTPAEIPETIRAISRSDSSSRGR